MNRINLSKKIRFDVFKRDNFKCQYCGRTPPDIVLEVDHIIPVCKSGNNDVDNLLTACFDCNRGKAGVELSAVLQNTADKIEILKERKLQYDEFKKLLKVKQVILNGFLSDIDDIYQLYFPECYILDRFRYGTISNFIDKIGFTDVKKAMNTACSIVANYEQCLKYFCGICWRKVRNMEAENNG